MSIDRDHDPKRRTAPVDALAWRHKFGVLAPSTNTIVEPDYYAMSVPGVTAQHARIHIRDGGISSNSGMDEFLAQVHAEMPSTIARVLTAEPDYLVMGLSSETFWGGVNGYQGFVDQIEGLSGLKLASGAGAAHRALDLLGVSRIACLTPYQENGDDNVRRFFTESGYDVLGITGLRCPTAVSISQVTTDQLRKELVALAELKPEAIIQCGTNLSMIALADEAERWLGIPVIAINAATWWMALRENGVMDQLSGFGSLLREH